MVSSTPAFSVNSEKENEKILMEKREKDKKRVEQKYEVIENSDKLNPHEVRTPLAFMDAVYPMHSRRF